MQESWSADNLSSRLHKIAERNIIKRLDNLPDQSSLLGSKWKNMRFDLEMDDVSHELYLVPVWFAEYIYRGAKYYAIAAGCNENLEYSAPKDSSKKSIESEFKKKWRFPLLLGVFSFLCLALVWICFDIMDENSWYMAFAWAGFSFAWWNLVAEIRKKKWKRIKDSNSSARLKAIDKLKSGTTLTDNDIHGFYDDCRKSRKILIYIVILLFIAGLVYTVWAANDFSSINNTSSVTQNSKPETDWFLSGDMSALPLVTATANVVNIREDPSDCSAIIGQLKKGEQGVVLINAGEEWNCVFYNQQWAYVSTKYSQTSISLWKRQMVVTKDDNIAMLYLGETSTHYYCETQETYMIEKDKAKITIYSAKDGNGIVAIKSNQKSAPAVFSSYSSDSELITHLPLDKEGYLPEPYKCLDYRNHMFLVAFEGSEGSGWVSENNVKWFPICLW